jgi:hypothetical protein
MTGGLTEIENLPAGRKLPWHFGSRLTMRGRLMMLTFLGSLSYCITAQAAPPRDDKDNTVTLAGLQAKAPVDWVKEKPTSNLRVGQFKLPGANGKDPAELSIYFFGEGQGGGVDANVKRWREMFEAADGKKSDELGKAESFKVGDVNVTYFDVQGTYLSKFPPFAPNAKTVRKPDHRMLGIIFECKNGPFFIRVVGPTATVEQHKKGFDEWLKSFK